MSEASSEHSAGGSRYSCEQLVQRLQRKAGSEADRFSLTDHLAAGRTLVRLRDALLGGEELSPRSQTTLLCVGIALRRRWLSTQNQVAEDDKADAKRDAEDALELLRKSVNLIFVLLCLVEKRKARRTRRRRLRGRWRTSRTRPCGRWSRRARRARARAGGRRWGGGGGGRGGEEGEGGAGRGGGRGGRAHGRRGGDAERGWARAAHGRRRGAHGPDDGRGAHRGGSEQDELALLYFRSEAASMATRLLLPSPSVDFVSLGTKRGDESVPRAKRLLAVAQAGESEAGQSILRDMVLSWLLPPRLVGVRRGLLLSRATSTAAGVDWPLAAQRARCCDEWLRVHLGEWHRRARAHVLPADGAGHPDNQGRRRGGSASSTPSRAARAAVVRDGARRARDKALRLTLVPEARSGIALRPRKERLAARRGKRARTGFEEESVPIIAEEREHCVLKHALF